MPCATVPPVAQNGRRPLASDERRGGVCRPTRNHKATPPYSACRAAMRLWSPTCGRAPRSSSAIGRFGTLCSSATTTTFAPARPAPATTPEPPCAWMRCRSPCPVVVDGFVRMDRPLARGALVRRSHSRAIRSFRTATMHPVPQQRGRKPQDPQQSGHLSARDTRDVVPHRGEPGRRVPHMPQHQPQAIHGRVLLLLAAVTFRRRRPAPSPDVPARTGVQQRSPPSDVRQYPPGSPVENRKETPWPPRRRTNPSLRQPNAPR